MSDDAPVTGVRVGLTKGHDLIEVWCSGKRAGLLVVPAGQGTVLGQRLMPHARPIVRPDGDLELGSPGEPSWAARG